MKVIKIMPQPKLTSNILLQIITIRCVGRGHRMLHGERDSLPRYRVKSELYYLLFKIILINRRKRDILSQHQGKRGFNKAKVLLQKSIQIKDCIKSGQRTFCPLKITSHRQIANVSSFFAFDKYFRISSVGFYILSLNLLQRGSDLAQFTNIPRVKLMYYQQVGTITMP